MGSHRRISTVACALAVLALPAWGGLSAQADGAEPITVTGQAPADLSGLAEGPEIEGFISARRGEQLQVTGADGSRTVMLVSEATRIRGSGGLLGLNKTELAADALLNGLPVSVETVQWGGGLVASQIRLKTGDLQTAAMIRNGTDQRFGENEAATEALRSRVGDIDQYNVHGTTNVYFDTGRWALTPAAENELCAAAAQAKAMDNALLLVVGYTDAGAGTTATPSGAAVASGAVCAASGVEQAASSTARPRKVERSIGVPPDP